MPRRLLPIVGLAAAVSACTVVAPGPQPSLPEASAAIVAPEAAPAAPGGPTEEVERSTRGAAAPSAAPTVRFGTPTAKLSAVGSVLEGSFRALDVRHGGAKVSGTYGWAADDALAMRLMAGQVDVAMLSGADLQRIHPSFAVLELPGLYPTEAQGARALAAVRADLERLANGRKLTVLGYYGEGVRHWMATGKAIGGPSGFGFRKPAMRRANPADLALFQAMGMGGSALQRGPAELQRDLESGAVDLVHASLQEAEANQWLPKIKHLVLDGAGDHAAYGAIVASQAFLDGLPALERRVVTSTFAATAAAVARKIRADDETALQGVRRAQAITISSPVAAQSKAWQAAMKTARERLVPGTVDAALAAKATEAATR